MPPPCPCTGLVSWPHGPSGWSGCPGGPSQLQLAEVIHPFGQKKLDALGCANIHLRIQGSRAEGTTLVGMRWETRPRAKRGQRVHGKERHNVQLFLTLFQHHEFEGKNFCLWAQSGGCFFDFWQKKNVPNWIMRVLWVWDWIRGPVFTSWSILSEFRGGGQKPGARKGKNRC